MARITVEDCLKKIDSQYDLVLLAKERTSQLRQKYCNSIKRNWRRKSFYKDIKRISHQ